MLDETAEKASAVSSLSMICCTYREVRAPPIKRLEEHDWS